MGKIADVIMYEGDNSTFIWKHPLEDFNSMTQLIVHESQEAIFFLNGQALDMFGPGRYTLETQNIPKIGGILKRLTGDQTPFHAEVYFINKTEQMSIRWGTDSKVQYVEPDYGFPLSIGACGEMSLRVEDSRKLLVKLVGTEAYLSQARLVDYFRSVLMVRIKTYVAQTMKAKAINIFEIDENLSVFSEEIHRLLKPDFSDYGVALEKFFVTTIVKPDGEPQYEKFKELHFRKYSEVAEAKLRQETDLIYAQTEAQKTVIESQAIATKRAQEGYTYDKERGYDVIGKVAENEGSGSDLRNAAMGIGMGFGAGGAFGNAMNTIANNTMSTLINPMSQVSTAASMPASTGEIPGMINLKEVENAEKSQEDEMSVFKKRLDKLSMMKETGMLSEEEFLAEKKSLLNEIKGV